MGVASRATTACTNTKDLSFCAVNPVSSVTARSVIIDVGPSTSVSASGESSVSSAAFTSHAGTSTVELTEITIRGGAASSLTASATQDAVASGGVASAGTSSASSVVRGLAVEVDGCQVRATGDSSVASLGVALQSDGDATCVVSGVSVRALRSELVSRGSACVASGGCMSHSLKSMFSSAANVTLRCEDAQVLSSGSAAVGSLSFTSYCAAQQEVDVQSLSVCAISSNITTLGSGDCASSVGAGACGSPSSTSSMAGISISATTSNVTTFGGSIVSSLGTAHSGARLTARDWTVYAERCRIESHGSDCVSSGGIACQSSASFLLDAFNVTFVFSLSTVQAHGSNGVASAGLASYGTSSQTTLEASSSSTIAASLCTLYSESSTISASGSGNAIASMGIASYNYCASTTGSSTSTVKVTSTSNISAADVTIHGRLTQCTASGADSIASMGVASRATTACTNTLDLLYCENFPRSSATARSVIIDVGPSSSASASGESSVSSAAFTSHAGTSTVELTEITIRGGAASSLTASATQDAVASGGVASAGTTSASSVVRGLAVEVDGCQVRATGDSSVASLGVALQSDGDATCVVSGVSVRALRSELVSRGSACVASGGCMSHSQRTMFSSAANVTLRCEDAQVLSSGSAAVGSLSFTSYCAAQQEVDVQSLSVCAISSNITTLGSGDCASRVGAGACGSPSSTSSMTGISISATTSNVTTFGGSIVSSLGTAHSGARLTARDWTVYAERCRIESHGSDCVSSGGIACQSSASFLLDAFNVTFVFSLSTVRAHGSNGVASAGLASYGTSSQTTLEASSLSTIAASLCTLYSESSTISASGSGNAIASMGIASYNYCASTTGSLTSTVKVTSTSNISAADVTIHGRLTQCTTSGADSIASMGVASRATAACTNTKDFLLCATSAASSVVGFAVSLSASRSSVSASGNWAVAVLALTSLVSCSELRVRICQSDVQCNASSSGRCACVFSSTPADSALTSTTGILVVVASRVSAPSSSSCISLRPLLGDTAGNVSVLQDVSLACTNVGWSGACSNCCGSNISVNESPLTASNVATWFSGIELNPISSCLTDSGCGAIAPPPMALPLKTGCYAPALSPSTAASASRSSTKSPTNAVSQTPPRTYRSIELSNSTSASLLLDSETLTWASSDSLSASQLFHPTKDIPNAAHVVEDLISSEAIATAIVGSGTASAAVASIVALPSAASYASRVGSLVKVADCGFASGIEADSVPDPLEHPFNFALGSSKLRHHAGGAVLTALLFVLLPCLFVAATHYLLGEAPQDHPKLCQLQRYVCGVLASLCLAYFDPGVLGTSVMLISYGEIELVAVGVLLFVVVIAAWRCALVAGLWRVPLLSQVDGRALWDFRQRLCITLWIFAEAAAELSRMTSRLYYAEEVFVSCALAALANVPPIRGSCTPLALAVIMLTAAHVAFQAFFHPYKELIDTGFSLAAGVLQVLLAHCQLCPREWCRCCCRGRRWRPCGGTQQPIFCASGGWKLCCVCGAVAPSRGEICLQL